MQEDQSPVRSIQFFPSICQSGAPSADRHYFVTAWHKPPGTTSTGNVNPPLKSDVNTKRVQYYIPGQGGMSLLLKFSKGLHMKTFFF